MIVLYQVITLNFLQLLTVQTGGANFTTNVTITGTPRPTGSYTELEITPETLGIYRATRTLYYYCSNHSGMGGNGYLSLTPRTDYADIGLVIAIR